MRLGSGAAGWSGALTHRLAPGNRAAQLAVRARLDCTAENLARDFRGDVAHRAFDGVEGDDAQGMPISAGEEIGNERL
jgi:hypothetical protein